MFSQLVSHSVSHGMGPSASTLAQRLSDALTCIAVHVRAWWTARRRYAQSIEQLRSMSEHDLHDIGLVRADVAWVASGVLRGGRGRE